MKKCALILFLVYSSLTVFAQTTKTTIVVDKEQNGRRIILTKREFLYSDGDHHANFGLSCSEDKYYRSFILFIDFYEGKLQMEKGARLLLKFDDGSVIELRNQKKIGPYDYEVTKNVEYHVEAMYKITPQQIKEMMDKTLVKIRIEHSIGEIDREVQSKLLPLVLNCNLFDINDALEKPKDFYSDF